MIKQKQQKFRPNSEGVRTRFEALNALGMCPGAVRKVLGALQTLSWCSLSTSRPWALPCSRLLLLALRAFSWRSAPGRPPASPLTKSGVASSLTTVGGSLSASATLVTTRLTLSGTVSLLSSTSFSLRISLFLTMVLRPALTLTSSSSSKHSVMCLSQCPPLSTSLFGSSSSLFPVSSSPLESRPRLRCRLSSRIALSCFTLVHGLLCALSSLLLSALPRHRLRA